MPRKPLDTAAAKAKKQKIILAVGLVILLAVAAIRVPALLSAGGGSAAAPAPSTGADLGAPAAEIPAPTTAAAVVPAVATPTKALAVVAGVPLPSPATVRPAPGQLASFTRFEAKDPFVPRGKNSRTSAEAAAEEYYDTVGKAPSAAPGSASGASSPSAAPKQAPAGPVAYATIDLDGKPQQVAVKGSFPAAEPLFVLRSLQRGQAKVGVVGGSFDDGQAVVLRRGKEITLVNTATGVRYVLKLVYTGAAPEQIASFSTKPEKSDATEDR